jgi:hypothetical protein
MACAIEGSSAKIIRNNKKKKKDLHLKNRRFKFGLDLNRYCTTFLRL